MHTFEKKAKALEDKRRRIEHASAVRHFRCYFDTKIEAKHVSCDCIFVFRLKLNE
jgi:hypothetical protein